jgi:hypothetical protein
MSLTINTKAYTFDSYGGKDTAVYHGPAHTFAVKDVLSVRRVAPKPTAIFAGVARSGMKFTRTLATGTDTTADAIGDVSVSIPVGAASADIDSLINDLGDAILDAVFTALVKAHDINF